MHLRVTDHRIKLEDGDAVKSVEMFLGGLDGVAHTAIILVLGILIIVSNTLIIATLLNYKGKWGSCKFNCAAMKVVSLTH